MLAPIRTLLTDVFNLFYPKVCLTCDNTLHQHEEVVCLQCERGLPLTGHYTDADNELAKRLWGRVELQGAMGLYDFHKGAQVQQLLHSLKYRKRQNAGTYVGQQLAAQLLQADCIIKNIDVIVPVPLHHKKEKQRGYNQCMPIAEAISVAMGWPVAKDALIRTVRNTSQTGMNRFERFENVKDIFAVKDATQLQGKHVLLVDDVVTTGATSESCIRTILSVPDTKVSFVAVGYAKG